MNTDIAQSGAAVSIQVTAAETPAAVPLAGSIDPTTVPHRRTIGWVGTSALAMGGSNQSIFLISALIAGQGTIPGQGSAAIPLLIVGLILSYAAAPGWLELVMMYPNRVGGIAASCTQAFKPYGEILSVLTGVCYWWGWVPTCGLTALFSASAIHQWLLPQVPVNAIAIAIVLCFLAINLSGIKTTTRVAVAIALASSALAFLSMIIPVLTGVVDWHKASSFHLITPFSGTFGQVTSLMAGLYLIGFGAPAFEAATCHVGETIDRERNVPRAVLVNALMAGLYFAVLPVIWLGVLGEGPLGGDLSQVLGPTYSPWFGSLGGPLAMAFIMFNMFHGTVQPLAGAARVLSQLAEDGLVPSILGRRLAPTDVPWVASTVTAVFAIWFLLIGDPIWLVAAANFTYLIGIALPNVAVWLLRRDAPLAPRPWRAPRGTIALGVVAAVVWGGSTLLGFEQFGLPTVVFGLAMAYSGALLYAMRKLQDRWASGKRGIGGTLHFKLTGAMLLVLALDAVGYMEAINRITNQNSWVVVALEDIFVAVAMLTISVGIVLPGMIGHSAKEISLAAERLTRGTLHDFSDAMRALGRGDLDLAQAGIETRPLDVHSQDELGEMALNFNEMQREIERAAIGLSEARVGLMAARSEVERATHAKSSFLATMTHEIRTPLNAIIGFANMLTESELTAEQAQQTAYLKEACASLVSIVNDVLDFSKIEAGRLQLELRVCNLQEMLDGTLGIIKPQADAKGLLLVLTLDRDVPTWVTTDPVRLRQVLLNLLSNAVKFTEKGAVKLHVARTLQIPDGVTFSVIDTGIGIPSDRQHLLFESFTQIAQPRVARNVGTGLGLAISKFIVEALGGEKIGVSSEPGRGSTFWFSVSLPLAERPVDAAAESGAAPAMPRHGEVGLRILVVDDVHLNQVVIEMMLKREGYDVTIAANGEEAVALARTGGFDLIFMDIEMPVMNGLDAARAIRALDAGAGVPIVALTANALSSEVSACREAGMVDYISKPIDRKKLMAAIHHWTGSNNSPAATGGQPTPAGQTFDPERLAELDEYFPPDRKDKFVAAFAKELKKTSDLIADSHDNSAIYSAIHDLCSSSGILGFVELSDACRRALVVLHRDASEEEREEVMAGFAMAAERAETYLKQRFCETPV